MYKEQKGSVYIEVDSWVYMDFHCERFHFLLQIEGRVKIIYVVFDW